MDKATASNDASGEESGGEGRTGMERNETEDDGFKEVERALGNLNERLQALREEILSVDSVFAAVVDTSTLMNEILELGFIEAAVSRILADPLDDATMHLLASFEEYHKGL